MATANLTSSSLTIPSFPPQPRILPTPNLPPDPPPPLPDPPPLASPPHPTPPPRPPLLSPPLPTQSWSSLFATKPRNAGDFSPPQITLKYDGKRLVPTSDIIEASVVEWHEYLTGFFLDTPLSYTAVVTKLLNLWKPRGTIKVKSNGSIFFFLVDDKEDRKRILEADPILIRNKVFIIKKWDVSMGLSGKGIRHVPVWVKFSNLPMVAWSKIGICWLATHVGKFLCMDQATESLDWLGFAKCLVEISPESELPESIPLLLPDGSEHDVIVTYVWKPDICCACKVFGHSIANCPSGVSKEATGKKNDNTRNDVNVNDHSKWVNPHEASGVRDNSAVFKRQNKVIPTRSNQKVRVFPFVNQKWKIVEGNSSKQYSGKVRSNTLATENRYGILECLSSIDEEANSTLELEEGEICVTAKENAVLEESLQRYEHSEKGLSQLNEISGAPNKDVSATARSNVSTTRGYLNLMNTVENIARSNVSASAEDREVLNKDVMQTIIDDVNEFEQIMNEGGFDVNTPLNVTDIQPNNEFGFKTGFLHSATPDNKQRNERTIQNSIQEQPAEAVIEGKQSSSVAAVQENTGNLDSFLHNNFNITEVTGDIRRKHPKEKEIMKRSSLDKTVLETIESLKDEIASGKIDPFLSDEKKKLMELMSRNYIALQQRTAAQDKTKKQSASNPYANIPPPPGYKARPPDVIVTNVEATAVNLASCSAESPITRSKSRAKGKTPFDNG